MKTITFDVCVSQKLWLRVYKVIKKWGRFVYSFLEKVVLLKKAKRRSSFFHKKCRPFFLEKKSSLSKYPLQQCIQMVLLSKEERERERKKTSTFFLLSPKVAKNWDKKAALFLSSIFILLWQFIIHMSIISHALLSLSTSLTISLFLSLSFFLTTLPSLSHTLSSFLFYLTLSLTHTHTQTRTHTHTLIFRAGFIVQICGCIILVCLLYKCILLHLASRKIVFHFTAIVR